MSKWLFMLFHQHKWKVHAERDVLNGPMARCIGQRILLQCQHCGKMRAQDFPMARSLRPATDEFQWSQFE